VRTGRDAWRPPPGWLRQAVLYAGAYAAYGASRWLVIGDRATAVGHAHAIAGLEARLGIAIEGTVQRALRGTVAMWPLNQAYLAAQVVVVPAALVWLYRRHRPAYRRLRDTVLAAWVLSLPVVWLFPVAPPRLAEPGVVDTITRQTGVALDSRLTTSLYNALAAMPSLHCGFAFAVSVALARTAGRPATRLLAPAWAPVIFIAVVATGNHFVSDVGGGVAITVLGFAVTNRRPHGRRGPPAMAPV
jgi:PAP2 superfamily